MFLEIGLICSGLYAVSAMRQKSRGAKAQQRKISEKNGGSDKSRQGLNVSDQTKVPVQTNRASSNGQKNMVVASASLGLAATGGLLYPSIGFLSVPGIVYCTMPRFRRTWDQLKQKKVSSDTMIAITVSGCVVCGYFFIASVAVFVNVLAQKLLSKITNDSRGKLIDIFRQSPEFVWILADGAEVRIPFEQIKEGDIAVVSSGEVVPADGTVVEGTASIDQHILTGEATPAEKGIGKPVFASTIVLSGRICIKVEKAGEETTVAKIGQILNRTVEFKSTVQLRSESFTDQTVLPILICSGISLPIVGPMGALAIINSHFKDKLSILGPISTLNFFRIASENAILIKDGRSLDLLDQVDTVVFDKTGTLTEEQPSVGSIYVCDDSCSENDILAYAAAAECRQTHPIARALVQESEERGLSLPAADETEYQLGYGLTVSINNRLIRVGSRRFMEMTGIAIPPAIEKAQEFCHAQGFSLVMAALDDHLVGAVELIPTVRPEIKTVIRQLRKRRKIKAMYIISGDHETPTKRLAQELGISHYFAETLPEQKADIIEQLKNEGRFVCYIGDGINDSIALKASHVSVSLRGASTAATDTAQIILMDRGLAHLDMLFDISTKFRKNMDISYTILLGQTVLGIGGVFLLGFGLPATIGLNIAALIGGTANSMIPLLARDMSGERRHGD